MQHIESFSRYLRFEKRSSEHTLIAYENDLKQFISFLGSAELDRLVEVKPKMIRNWVVELHDTGMSPRSIHRKISALKTFYKHLQIKGWTDHNPAQAVNLPKIPKRLPVFVKESDMEQLLDHI